MRHFTFTIVLILTTCVSLAQPVKTGVTYRDFADSTRSKWLGTGPRPLRSDVWYPAGTGGQQETINDAQQFSAPVLAFRNAQLTKGKKYPLILISHGARGNATQMRWLAFYLALKGYITVVINHNGTDIEERKTDILTLSDFCMWERPRDITVVLDKMLKDSFFAANIDTSRIAVAGFSLGGATAIWVAGGILNLDTLAKNEPAPPAQFLKDINAHIALTKTDPVVKNSIKHSGDSFKDNRIKAVFALSPAIGQGFTKDGLKNITVPVQIVVGDADLIAPMALNARHYAQNIPTAKKLIVLPGERGHYTKPPIGNERPAELQEVSEIALQFFNEALGLR